jgi:hypothetical protein
MKKRTFRLLTPHQFTDERYHSQSQPPHSIDMMRDRAYYFDGILVF